MWTRVSLLILACGIVYLIAYVVDQDQDRITRLESQMANCSCNVSWGGHTMSVEDALERMGEGLTIDQWKEVQVMIDNAMNESAGK